jgi:hypothetical protein
VKTHSTSQTFPHRQTAFTLAETLIASSIFVMLMGSLVYTFLFGLHLQETTATKLGASDNARKALIHLTDEIRSAATINIGSGDPASFAAVGTNSPQVGTSMQILTSTNTNNWVCYYYETNGTSSNFAKLCRTESASVGGSTIVVATSITNIDTLFTSEDVYGNPLMNNQQANRVIGVTLQFYQLEYPAVKVGPGNFYDFYQLHTRITRRKIH